MIQNAILYVLRKKKRTCILFIILTTVLSFLYSSLNIMKLSNNLENDLYKISNTSISITQKDNQSFEINQFKEMENIQEIKEIIPQYDCLAKATNVEVVDGIQKVERENLPEILKNTFSIESTNSTKNNVLFNSGIFTIIDGRHIEKNDREKILIHEELAKKNNLKLHSKIQLRNVKKGKNNNVFGSIDIICPKNLSVESDCSFNHGVYINAINPITLGKDVTLSAGSKLISTGIDYKNWINGQKNHLKNSGIQIGNHVWLGANSMVLSDVKISGEYIIIAANSVVTSDVEDSYVVLAGTPAKIIKYLK